MRWVALICAALILMALSSAQSAPTGECLLPDTSQWPGGAKFVADLDGDGKANFLIVDRFRLNPPVTSGGRLTSVTERISRYYELTSETPVFQIYSSFTRFPSSGEPKLNGKVTACGPNAVIVDTFEIVGNTKKTFFVLESPVGRPFASWLKGMGATDEQISSLIPGVEVTFQPGPSGQGLRTTIRWVYGPGDLVSQSFD